MDFDHDLNERVLSPVYILPDDPPDIKPDPETLVAVKEEASSTNTTALNGPADNKSDLQMLADVKEEVNSAGTASSSDAFDGPMLHYNSCNFECLGQDHLSRHVKYRHINIGKIGRHKCESCKYSTDSIGHFRQHVGIHTAERPFRCDQCGKAFSRKGTLKSHCLTHTDQKPHSCDVCGKAFKRNNGLVVHKRIHTREKVKVCKQCGAKFNQLSHYIVHMQSHKDSLKNHNHRCEVCSARFVSRQYLIIHMRKHTGERSYCCSFCQARFSTLSGMQDHTIRRHTYAYKQRCAWCNRGFIKPRELNNHVGTCFCRNWSMQMSQY